MPKTFSVELPIAGYLSVTVEVDDDADEDAAIEKALESDYTIDDVTEWEVPEHIARGELNYAVLRFGNAFELAAAAPPEGVEVETKG